MSKRGEPKTVKKITLKGNFIRVRVRSPKLFIPSSFRTQKIGKHRRIAGRLRSTGGFATQALLHPKKERHGPGRKFVCKNDRCRRLSGR